MADDAICLFCLFFLNRTCGFGSNEHRLSIIFNAFVAAAVRLFNLNSTLLIPKVNNKHIFQKHFVCTILSFESFVGIKRSYISHYIFLALWQPVVTAGLFYRFKFKQRQSYIHSSSPFIQKDGPTVGRIQAGWIMYILLAS